MAPHSGFQTANPVPAMQRKACTCDICKVDKPLVACWHTPKVNRNNKTRKSRCYDCTLPPCSFLDKGCKTCQQCRNPECRTRPCTKAIAVGTLNTQQLPASLKDVRNFACNRCQYKRCSASQLAKRKTEPLNKALPNLAPRFFPAESLDKSATQIPTGWDTQEYKIAHENYLHN